MVVVVFATAVFFLRVIPFLFEDAGYAGSRSRPPWVRIYCPHVVDDLISRWDVLGGGFGFGLLATETTVGGSAGFFTEREARRAAWLVKLGAVGSSWGAGKAYL